MYLLTEAIPLIIKNYLLLFFNIEFLLLLALVVVLIGLQYRRAESVRAAMFGVRPRRLWRDTFAATLLGLAGGLAGSILMMLAGLPLTGSGSIFILLLVIAGLLMLISPRFMCFAYAGGLISLVNILTGGWPAFNIYQVLALVAVLHMVESLLIFFSGHLGAVPSFFRDQSGRTVGGFTLQKFWPIPLVALTVAGYSVAPDILNDMPRWWPLIKPGGEGSPDFQAVYALIAVVAGLGYGDLAVARSPWEKSRLSAFFLALYSIILFSLSALAQYFRFMAPVAAIFSPLGHELVIYIGRKLELAGKPLFTASRRGLRVLDVDPDSIAWRMGIRSGDVLVTVGGIPVHDHWSLKYAMDNNAAGPLEVEYLKGAAQAYNRGWAFRPGTNMPLGVLPVPSGYEEGIDINNRSRLALWWEKIKS